MASAVLVVTLLWQLVVAWPAGFGGDYQTYVNATNRFLAGQSLYATEQLSGSYYPRWVVLVGYVYPPPSVLLFLPFRPGLLGLAGWLLLSVGLLVGGIASIVRHELNVPWPTALATSLVSLVLILAPFASGVLPGNVNVALAGLLALCWSLDRPRFGSVAAGIGALIKLYPGFLALSVGRTELVRSLTLTAAVAFGIVLITLPVVGIGSWRDFLAALSNGIPLCGQFPSVVCALAPTVGYKAAGIVALAAGAGLAALSIFVRDRRARFLLIAYAMIVPVADLWPHYWLIPFVAAFAATANTVGPAFRRLDQRNLHQP